ncbi:AAA family ATPase [Lachnospiraceae bacterium 54-53]
MELKRDIYEELLKWKKAGTGKVLEVRGARQTGKTYIIDKFSRENYKTYIYINMAQTSGEEFLGCLDQVSDWKPGEPRKDKALQEAFKLFDGRFEDCENTIVVIDEIQESARVYSLIRQFSREFTSNFVVVES